MTGFNQVDDFLSDDLTCALTNLDNSPPSPGLDLDPELLPPLDDFSAVEEALGFGQLELDLASSPSPPHISLPSDSSVSSHSLNSPRSETNLLKEPECCPNVKAALNEVSERLKAATNENAALRTRVADLVRENRSLRSNLDVAQKQAQANPLLLGLAQVSAEAAGALANALNTVPKPPPGKKRKRAAAGKTLACLVLMCGFFFGSPGVISDSDRTDANLPAIWGGDSKRGVVRSNGNGIATPPVRPSLCLRTLEQLPPPELASKNDDVVKKEIMDAKHEPINVMEAVEPMNKKRRVNKFSYVMCRDAPDAVQQVSECAKKMKDGHSCGPPHEISLIMPAAALLGEDAEMTNDDEYAEVKCNIMSVQRIPAGQTPKSVSGATAAKLAMKVGKQKPFGIGPRVGKGRVLGSVREEVVGT